MRMNSDTVPVIFAYFAIVGSFATATSNSGSAKDGHSSDTSSRAAFLSPRVQPGLTRSKPRAQTLGVDSALADGVGYAVDCKHVRRDAVVHVVGFGVADDIVE